MVTDGINVSQSGNTMIEIKKENPDGSFAIVVLIKDGLGWVPYKINHSASRKNIDKMLENG